MLGHQLSKLRRKKKKTQEEVSKDLGIPRSTYSNYESGKREPDLATTKLLAEYFGVTMDELSGGQWQMNEQRATYTTRPYEGIMKEIADKYPGVDLDDPDIKRKLMKMIDLVLDDYTKKQ